MDDIRLGVKTKFNYHKNVKADQDTAVFGIPLKYSDFKEHEIEFEHKWKTIEADAPSAKLMSQTQYAMNVEIDFDYNVDLYEFDYYSVLDIVS